MNTDARNDAALVQGEFFSDGKTFVFRLAGTPFSGVGDTPSAAFEDLMRVDAQTRPLSVLIRDRARDQQGDAVRATIVRTAMIGLIVLAVLGGAIAATASILPSVVADIGGAALTHLADSVDTMSPKRQAEISRVADRINKLIGRQDMAVGCSKDSVGRQP